ncbi:branched-chain amino acid ABC transporter permease [bacterium]|nr:MAG: branched-chain amino acid ABC transporter permease [bacterium]
MHGFNIAQLLVDGIVAGSMYALMASGISLIWGTMRMLNFAHGEFYMIGGYTLFFALVALKVHPVIAVGLGLLATFMLGVVVERLIMRWLLLRAEWEMPTLVATLGLSVFMQNFALRTFGAGDLGLPYVVPGVFRIAGVVLPGQRIAIVLVAIVAFAVVWSILRYTKFGVAIRATSQDRDTAVLMGIDFPKVYMLTFGISVALAALAATMLAPIYSVNPWMGQRPMLKAFIVVVFGGLGSLEGAILGGVVLGIIESVGVAVVSSEWQDVIAFAILILVLWVRPQGLFGAKES